MNFNHKPRNLRLRLLDLKHHYNLKLSGQETRLPQLEHKGIQEILITFIILLTILWTRNQPTRFKAMGD